MKTIILFFIFISAIICRGAEMSVGALGFTPFTKTETLANINNASNALHSLFLTLSNGIPGLNGTNGLNGINGAAGIQGIQGVQGVPGVNGTNGSQGVQGIQGIPGINGTNGVNGAQGIQGIAGTSGTNGMNGTSGTNGVNGTSGTNGVNGVNGTNGVNGINATNNLTVKASVGIVTNSTVTAAKITSLDTTTGTGTFAFQYFIRYQSSITTTGVKFSVNHSGTLTSFVCNLRYGSTGGAAATAAPTQAGNVATGNIHESFTARLKSATANMGPTVSVDAANADMLVVIEGLMVVTVNGDIQLYHASETAAATRVMNDSVLILTKIL